MRIRADSPNLCVIAECLIQYGLNFFIVNILIAFFFPFVFFLILFHSVSSSYLKIRFLAIDSSLYAELLVL